MAEGTKSLNSSASRDPPPLCRRPSKALLLLRRLIEGGLVLQSVHPRIVSLLPCHPRGDERKRVKKKTRGNKTEWVHTLTAAAAAAAAAAIFQHPDENRTGVSRNTRQTTTTSRRYGARQANHTTQPSTQAQGAHRPSHAFPMALRLSYPTVSYPLRPTCPGQPNQTIQTENSGLTKPNINAS